MNLRGLVKYALFRDTTQHGEFEAMRQLAGRDCPQSIVDVGANDGFYASNSYPFVARGWRALLIEPHPVAFAKLQKLHARRGNVTAFNLACAETAGELPLWIGLDGDEGTLSTLSTDNDPGFPKTRTEQSVLVRVERLDAVLAQQNFPRQFGILSVDAERMDYEVLLGLDLTVWRPRLIIVENYPPKDAQKAEYLERHGYRHRLQCSSNALWAAGQA